MGRPTVIALCRVSDTTHAERTLFDILDKYRLHTRREVFDLPDMTLVDAAFRALVDSINALGNIYPERFSAEMCDPIYTVLIERCKEKGLEEEERKKRRKESSLMQQEDNRSRLLREYGNLSDRLDAFIRAECEIGKTYFLKYSDLFSTLNTHDNRLDPKRLVEFMVNRGFVKVYIRSPEDRGTKQRGYMGLRLKKVDTSHVGL